MRRFVTLGVFSLATVLYGACGDDGGDGGIGGNGGTGASGGAAGSGGSAGQGGNAGTGNMAGSAGTAGQGGTAGTAGAGGSAGNAGSAGTAGNAGSGGNDPDAGDGGVVEGDGGLGDASLPPPCTGCLELRAPLVASGNSAYFQLAFASTDLSDATATFRLRALVFDESGQTLITPFATSFDGASTYTQGNGTSLVNNAATFTNTETFIDAQLDIGAIASFDDTKVIAVGIQVFAGGTYAGPAPTLALDSITFTGTNAPANMDFTTDAQGFAVQTGLSVAGTEIIHH